MPRGTGSLLNTRKRIGTRVSRAWNIPKLLLSQTQERAKYTSFSYSRNVIWSCWTSKKWRHRLYGLPPSINVPSLQILQARSVPGSRGSINNERSVRNRMQTTLLGHISSYRTRTQRIHSQWVVLYISREVPVFTMRPIDGHHEATPLNILIAIVSLIIQ